MIDPTPTPTLADAVELGGQAPAREARLHELAAAWPVGERLRAAAVEEVAAQLRAALATPLHEVLAAGWRTTDAARALAGHQPGETETLDLAEHTIRWSATPAVELVMDGTGSEGAPLATIGFAVDIAIAVRAGVLVVQGGRFVRLHAAALEVTASLAVEDVPLAEWSRPLPVPGTLVFGDEGVPVAGVPDGAVGSAVSVPAIAP